MKLRSLMLLSTVLALLFALALLLGPAIILKFFGLTGSASEVILAQLIGAGLIGVGILSWYAKDAIDPQALQGTLVPLFIATAVAFVVALLAVLGKIVKGSNGWIVVVLFLAFAAGFAYFQFVGPRE